MQGSLHGAASSHASHSSRGGKRTGSRTTSPSGSLLAIPTHTPRLKYFPAIGSHADTMDLSLSLVVVLAKQQYGHTGRGCLTVNIAWLPASDEHRTTDGNVPPPALLSWCTPVSISWTSCAHGVRVWYGTLYFGQHGRPAPPLLHGTST